MLRPLTWLYRRLGARYPAVYVTLELQTAFAIALGAVLLFSFYYDTEPRDVGLVIAITMSLTAIAIAIVLGRTYPRLRPLRDWIAGDRTPAATREAWATAIHMPRELISRDFGFPVFVVAIPASIISVVIYDLSWITVLPIIVGSLVALGYAGILHYLALEMAMRPVLFDINAALDKPIRLDRAAVPLRVKLLASLPLINVITGMTVAALSADGGGGQAPGVNVLIALAVAFTISFELTVLLSRSIIRPLEDLEAATERIRQGRFNEHVPVTTADEFGQLSAAFNQMVDGLAEREQLRAAFGTYLDEEVARHIIEEGYDPKGAEREVSLVFCDVRGFTEAASNADAAEVVARLNEMFEVIVPIVWRHRGHVDQFVGDGVLAVFGAPARLDNHADRAVQAAVEISRTVNSRRPGGFTVGVGVNTGTVVVGSIGGAGRLSFSVIGDAVNLCARVEAETRETGDPVLITGETRAQLSETMEVRSLGEREIRGYSKPIDLYAPVVPTAVEPGGPGIDLAETLTAPVTGGLGRAPRPGDGLGRRAPDGLGRGPSSGARTLPGG